MQAAIHTDTLNECGFVEDTIAAFKDRNPHLSMRVLEDTPDIMQLCGSKRSSSSQTQRCPTLLTRWQSTDMLWSVPSSPSIPEDVALLNQEYELRPLLLKTFSMILEPSVFSL